MTSRRSSHSLRPSEMTTSKQRLNLSEKELFANDLENSESEEDRSKENPKRQKLEVPPEGEDGTRKVGDE